MSARAYAGIGSRRTPEGTLELMEQLACALAKEGWVLRTGLSPGADQAFYRGALAGGGRVELYLPWPGFQAHARAGEEGSRVHVSTRPTQGAYELAARFYEAWERPSWEQLDAGARALLARDCQQVLGERLGDPAARVVCWTPDGGLDGEDPRAGGTGQALRVAARHGIPVLNLARRAHALALREHGLPD